MTIEYNLVLQDRNWVMERIANHFHKYIPCSKISNSADHNSDINFYFNWHAMKSKTKFDVCYFTHIENRKWWNQIANSCDVALLMGKRYSSTIPEHKSVIFYPPVFEEFLPQEKLKVLVVGRQYKSGRKNLDLVSEMQNEFNIDVLFTNGTMSLEELINSYKNTDYVLVTSNNEAGPMCVVEAMAMKKPVIAPDVGWCWEYPVIRYKDKQDLINIFNKICVMNSWQSRVLECVKGIESIYLKQGK